MLKKREARVDYQGSTIRDVVVAPVDDHIVSVHIASRPHILPKVEGGEVAPPCIPGCQYRHIIRTPNSVMVVEVEVRTSVYPRIFALEVVEKIAQKSLLDTLEEDNITPTPEAYAKGLKALTQRIVRHAQLCGVEII